MCENSLAKLLAQLNLQYIDTVSDRRGTVVARVTDGNTVMALKYHNPSVPDAHKQSDLLLREARFSLEVNDIAGGWYIGSGIHPNAGPWLLSQWVRGVSSSIYCGTQRNTEITKNSSNLALFCRIVEMYRLIHLRGILHGDVQPQHVIVRDAPTNLALLDWGLARRTTGDDFGYGGGFVHYVAPEVAKGMLEGDPNIEYSCASEIYSIGATLYFLLKGTVPVDYGDHGLERASLTAKLQAVAAGHLKVFRAPSGYHGNVEDVIQRCLEFRPSERFATTDKLLEALNTCTAGTEA